MAIGAARYHATRGGGALDDKLLPSCSNASLQLVPPNPNNCLALCPKGYQTNGGFRQPMWIIVHSLDLRKHGRWQLFHRHRPEASRFCFFGYFYPVPRSSQAFPLLFTYLSSRASSTTSICREPTSSSPVQSLHRPGGEVGSVCEVIRSALRHS